MKTNNYVAFVDVYRLHVARLGSLEPICTLSFPLTHKYNSVNVNYMYALPPFQFLYIQYPVSVVPVGVTQDSVHTELVKFTHKFKVTSAETVSFGVHFLCSTTTPLVVRRSGLRLTGPAGAADDQEGSVLPLANLPLRGALCEQGHRLPEGEG